MKIITSVSEIIAYSKELANSKKTMGFVPTMGALHRGHVSLIKQSVSENDITVVSIFVNPKQFNEKTDFDNYPNNFETDKEILISEACDVLFYPKKEDVYSNYEGYKLDFEGLDNIYEGEFRPGHFQGVVDVVYRLFEIIKPCSAYFGEKDFQQLAIIKLMVRKSNLVNLHGSQKINIIACPIIREANGLAMSSRNKRLSNEEFAKATIIYKLMSEMKKNATLGGDSAELVSYFNSEIDKIEGFSSEYAVFCDAESLKSIRKFDKNVVVMLCVAIWCGKIRLIDNISLVF